MNLNQYLPKSLILRNIVNNRHGWLCTDLITMRKSHTPTLAQLIFFSFEFQLLNLLDRRKYIL